MGLKACSLLSFMRQVQTVLIDNKCQELWSLLKSAQNSKNITSPDIIRYRREAERHVGQDDQLYRLQWVGYSCAPSLSRPSL